LRRDGTI